MDALLRMGNITKRFPGVVALEDVSLEIGRGEVHALMGENGAGKSTLIKILMGIYQKDKGTIVFDGEQINPHNVAEAESVGITTIYQELNLIPYLTVSENIFIGHYPKKRGAIDWKRMHAEAEALLLSLDVHLDVHSKIADYGTASQQMIAIARALHVKSKLLIMDEPTSSLDLNEVQTLFSVIRRLKQQGVSIIFVTHRLSEIYQVCSKVSILKDGHFVGTYDIEALDNLKLIDLMIGKEREVIRKTAVRRGQNDEMLLELKDIYQGTKLHGLSLTIRRGEILGLAGLLGSGRTETAKIIFGYESKDRGSIVFQGKPIRLRIPKAAVRLGIALCPEDRRVEGLIPHMSVRDNISLAAISSICSGPFISHKRQRALAQKYISLLQIKTPTQNQLVRNLSGGNQQKVVLAKWLCTNPQLMILDEPTRGIDVGAKDEIAKIIQSLSEQGISILLISSELSELVQLCSRVLVIREGRSLGDLSGDDISEDRIMKMIAEDHKAELV